jgi:hypothetical protein
MRRYLQAWLLALLPIVVGRHCFRRRQSRGWNKDTAVFVGPRSQISYRKRNICKIGVRRPAAPTSRLQGAMACTGNLRQSLEPTRSASRRICPGRPMRHGPGSGGLSALPKVCAGVDPAGSACISPIDHCARRKHAICSVVPSSRGIQPSGKAGNDVSNLSHRRCRGSPLGISVAR